MSDFLGLRSNVVSADPADIDISEVNDSAEDVKEPNQESECFVRDCRDEAKVEEPTCSNNWEMEVAETNEVIAEMNSKCGPGEPSAFEGSRCSDIHNNAESLSMVPGSSNKGHSSTFDPNFVETYFKVRRVI